MASNGAQQNPAPEGSLRSLVRKASDFCLEANIFCRKIESHPKNKRYVTLKLQQMYNSLVELYSIAFTTQWSHFKPIADLINPQGTDPAQAPVLLARLYISHWILDLHNSNHNDSTNSNEYDVVLCHLNSVIRPTHVKGCPADQIYIPRFAEQIDWTSSATRVFNPFRLENWNYNPGNFKAIIQAIKDKRSGWNIATLTTETVGRPVWLFDWHLDNDGCAWFPKKDNYDLEDVSYAYLIGVACTPHLGPQDMDDWQTVPNETNVNQLDLNAFRRIQPRRFFGDYEVESYTIHNFVIDITAESGYEQATQASRHKRARPARAEGYTSQPATRRRSRAYGDQPTTRTLTMLRRTTFVYYERTILELTNENRVTMLLEHLHSPNTYSVP